MEQLPIILVTGLLGLGSLNRAPFEGNVGPCKAHTGLYLGVFWTVGVAGLLLFQSAPNHGSPCCTGGLQWC